MKIMHKICLSLLIFGVILISAFRIDQIQKRDFYAPIDMMALNEVENFIVDAKRIPFAPREYIRQIADDSFLLFNGKQYSHLRDNKRK